MTIVKIKKEKRTITLSVILVVFVLLYILFALKRIKYSFSFQIDGVALTNEIWLFPTVFIFKNVITKHNKISLNKVKNLDINLLLLYIGLLIIILIGGFKADSIEQYLYSFILVVVPMSFLFFIDLHDINYFDFFVKLLVSLNLVYSILAIISSLNYGFLMELLGNETNYRYYTQYRASLMLGSSITVSYYLNLTLPLCFFMNYTYKEKRLKVLSLVSIILNVAATAILLSRLAFLISIWIVMFYFLFVKSNELSKFRKIIYMILSILLLINVLNDFNLSRLFSGFQDLSTSIRFTAMNLGLYLFKKNPIFGTGLGKYFSRAYLTPNILVEDIPGLVDPHNLYIMVLSEIGIIGFVILSLIFFKLIREFKFIENVILKKTAYIIMFVFLIGAIGGSQLFNEISFSTLFWIYISLFRGMGKKDYIIKHKN